MWETVSDGLGDELLTDGDTTLSTILKGRQKTSEEEERIEIDDEMGNFGYSRLLCEVVRSDASSIEKPPSSSSEVSSTPP